MEETFFTVATKPESDVYTDLDAATAAADAAAAANPGVEYYIMESRRGAISPKPDVTHVELPQV